MMVSHQIFFLFVFVHVLILFALCPFSDMSSSFAAPVVSFVLPSNTVLTDGGSITVTGLDFRSSEQTPSAGVQGVACTTSAWTSKTSVACAIDVGSGAGAARYAGVTVSGVVGTGSAQFTFDGLGVGSLSRRLCLFSWLLLSDDFFLVIGFLVFARCFLPSSISTFGQLSRRGQQRPHIGCRGDGQRT